MKISVLISNYNYSQYLPACVESVLRQSHSDYEIVIVDDGSTDDSKEVITQLQAKHPNKIVSIFQENQGQGAAFNAAFEVSTGEIIAFLDADDTWINQKLEEVNRAFSTLDIVGFIHPLLKVDAEEKAIPGFVGKTKSLGSDLAQFILDTGNVYWFPPTSGLSFRRSDLEKVFPIDQAKWRICADGCLMFCTAFLGKFEISNEILGSYRIHSSNNYVAANRVSSEKLFKSLSGIEMTNNYINCFLEKLNDDRRVNLKKNLPYLRSKFYLKRDFNIPRFIYISRLILSWKLYAAGEKINYLLRFWAKSFWLITQNQPS